MKSVVSRTRGGIGYLSLGHVRGQVKILSLEGFKPTIENIKQGRYRLARILYLLTKGKLEGIDRDFVGFVLSSKIQNEIVKGTNCQ